jgi:hypothetical protein
LSPRISAACSSIVSDTCFTESLLLITSSHSQFLRRRYVHFDILLPVMYKIFFHRNCLTDDFTCTQCFVWSTKISHPSLTNCNLQSWQGRFPEFCLQRVIDGTTFYSSLT